MPLDEFTDEVSRLPLPIRNRPLCSACNVLRAERYANTSTKQAWKGLTAGKDQIPVGTAKDAFKNFEEKKQEMFAGFAAHMRKQEEEQANQK